MPRRFIFSTLVLLCLLAGCGPAASSTTTGGATATAPPTPGITPTLPVPQVATPRPVHFMTSDHIRLAGLLFGRGKTVVICSHESGTTQSIWTESGMAQRLAARGYLVLTYDFRGNGASAGAINEGNLDVDLRAAVAFARQQGATRIVLLGSSMGGTATLQVAASTPIAAAITLSAPIQLTFEVSDAQLKAISAPKLFIDSQSDLYADDTIHSFKTARAPREMHLYPGAAHGVAIFAGPYSADLTQRILSFLARYAPASA